MNNDRISALCNAQVLLDGEFKRGHTVLLKGAVIHDVVADDSVPSELATSDLAGQYLVPGFIDLQVNGGGGIMFNAAPTVKGLTAIADAHRQYGTTGFMPTLITDDFSVMRQAISAVNSAVEQGVPGVLGIHLEGPFINTHKKGAHDGEKIRPIDTAGVELVTSLVHGKTMVTIAPERAAPEVIRTLAEHGVIVCAGHSQASYQQLTDSIESGVSGVTHLYNAMTQLGSREPGMVGAALANDELWFGIIADGHHMHNASLKIALRAKPDGGAILVTDAMASVGHSEKSFVLNGEKIHAVNGHCINSQGVLAGSDLDMNSAIKNAVQLGEVELAKAVNMATQYPAQVLGLQNTLGCIKAGAVANLVALDLGINVSAMWVNGERC